MARMTFEATKDMRAAQHVLGHTNLRQTEAYVRSMLTAEIDEAAATVYDGLELIMASNARHESTTRFITAVSEPNQMRETSRLIPFRLGA